jgi:putative membrane protein
MLRPSRSLPALLAAVAVMLGGTLSLALAGDGQRHHRGDGHHAHGHGHGHGHGHKSCSWKRVSGLDERWLTVHIETNLFEIAGGEAALDKAVTAEARELAAHLVRDHSAALAEAQAVAEKLGIAIPDRPAPLQEWSLRAVAQFEGIDFDRWFADLQVAGHQQAIVEAAFEAKRGCNAKVRKLAVASLPVLQAHLEHAEAVLAAVSD